MYTNVKGYSDKQLLDRVKKLNSYKSIPKGYWILGVRSNEDEPNKYDDKFYLFQGEKFIMLLSGTTHAGTPSLLGGYKKSNLTGSFVIKSDFWQYDLWKNGSHKGKMPALVQNTSVVGYRDNDNDNKAEELGKEVKGWYSINFHSSSYNALEKVIGVFVGGWSEGCQVCNNRQEYNKLINFVSKEKTVTYCLINEF